MPKPQPYIESYELRRIILFGSAGSLGFIFSILFLLFVGSQMTSRHHPPISTDTVGEMMGYVELLAFTFFSYFFVAVIVWKFKNVLSMFVASWLPIAFFGSFLLCVSFLSRVWIRAVLTYSENSPYQSRPESFSSLLLFASLCGIVFFVLTSFSCLLTGALVKFDDKEKFTLS